MEIESDDLVYFYIVRERDYRYADGIASTHGNWSGHPIGDVTGRGDGSGMGAD